MRHDTARGRYYEDGPFSFCDQADVHAQPCTCALSPMRPLAEVLREETVMPPAVYDGSCYWPVEDAGDGT